MGAWRAEDWRFTYFVPNLIGSGLKSHGGVVECCLWFLQRGLPTCWTGLQGKRCSTLGCFSRQMCKKRGEELFLNFRVPMLQTLQARRRGSSSKDFLHELLPAAPLILFLQVPKELHLEARTSRLWLEFCHLNRSCSGNRMNSFSFWVVPNIQFFWGILAQISFCFFKLFL